MPEEYKPTTPKPFVFVLMPFDKRFDDIYKFGIKGAADKAGAYAERVDEQMFDEGILERVFNQISKADVLVADMTGRNPNVFYEVGYAHALGKIVVLLTQDPADIPFDLKNRPHIVYGGSIETLKTKLSGRLLWAVREATERQSGSRTQQFVISLGGSTIPEASANQDVPVVSQQGMDRNVIRLRGCARNVSHEESPLAQYIYLFTSPDSSFIPCHRARMRPDMDIRAIPISHTEVFEPLDPLPEQAGADTDGLCAQYRLGFHVPNLPPQAVEDFEIELMFTGRGLPAEATFRLRLHTYLGLHDFPFRLLVTPPPKNRGS